MKDTEQGSSTVSDAQRARFRRLSLEAIRERHVQGEDGIGTLGEKRMHAIIKRYLCEDEKAHEVGVKDTRYVSDVRIGNEVWEVQTGDFYPMRTKIAHYMEKTELCVSVVHPITVNKWVSWVDPLTRAVSQRVRSPKHEKSMDLLPQLYSLIPYLGQERLRFQLLLIEAIDFKVMARRGKNRKKGAVRYERIPISLLGVEDYSTREDFARLIPKSLPSPFTVKEFSSVTGIRGRDAYSAVRVLLALGLVEEAEKIGRAMAFRRVTNREPNA